MITILAFVGLLAVLILSHELGHFIAARRFGIKVLEFGFGFPPRLFAIKRGETVYSINLLPFGGFVRLLGEEDPTLPGSLASKSIIARLIVLSAGSMMNILLPLALFSLSFAIPHNIVTEKVVVEKVAPGSPAYITGIESGDIILTINNRPVRNRGEIGYFIRLNLGSETTILLQKPDLSQKEVKVIPRWDPPPGQGPIGIVVTGVDSTIIRQSYPFWKAVPLSIQHSGEILFLFRNEIMSWFIRGTLPQLIGPVGIAQLTGEMAKAGISPLLEFTALISLNLAIINLFPFPGLDGGRLIFVFLEWLRRGKKISPEKEGLVHLIGFIILIIVILAVTYQDILRIIRGERLFP